MHAATFQLPVAKRFVWKEYRSLRALWFAVLLLGLFIQWFVGFVLPRDIDWATIYFTIALAASVLYTVGAASTVFSLEDEDETHGFLLGMPTSWLPVFAGKLVYVAASALALAAALSIVGWFAADFDTPGRADTPRVLGIFGLGIVEALAWGTLFSLIVKRPLLAAIMTLAVGTVAVQIAATLSLQQSVPLANPESYFRAIPLRLAIVAAVLLAAVLRARLWFAPRRARLSERAAADTFESTFAETSAPIQHLRTRVAAFFHPATCRGMVVRLLWQTLRQSWTLLLAPLGVAALFAVAILAVQAGTSQWMSLAAFVFLLAFPLVFLLPGLYGALVFSGDQRHRSYRFLAEHGAHARYVWLARHLVWGGTLVAIIAAIVLAIISASGWTLFDHLSEKLSSYVWRTYASQSIVNGLLPYVNRIQVLTQILAATTFGVALAYSIGQLYSMTIRSEILAAFVACVSTFVVAAWCALMFGWHLSSWWTVLPLALGLLLATWLRAPAWLTERNGWRHWWPAIAAIAVPAALVFAAIPAARLAQVEPAYRAGGTEATLALVRKAYDADNTEAARETAAMYLRSIELPIDGKTQATIDGIMSRWRRPEYMKHQVLFGESEIDVDKIPIDLRDEYHADRKRQLELVMKLHESAAIQEFLAATHRPTCRFDFHSTPVNEWWITHLYDVGLQRYFERGRPKDATAYFRLVNFMWQLAAETDGPDALDRYFALLRASQHLRYAQPTSVFIDQLIFESLVLEMLANWALRPERSEAEVRDALTRLEQHSATSPDPAESIYAVREEVRRVLSGKEWPLSIEWDPDRYDAYLAMYLNGLPWEEERAVMALDVAVARDIRRANELVAYLAAEAESHWPGNPDTLRATIQWETGDIYNGRIDAPPNPFETLGEREYRLRNDFGNLASVLTIHELRRRATFIQLALALYRLENGRYPETLAELAPKYLAEVPLDLFSGKVFHYEPRGLDHPLVNQWSGGASNDLLPARIPFFWSIGPWNVTTLQEYYQPRDANEFEANDPDAHILKAKGPRVFSLTSPQGSFFRGYGAGVFGLAPAPENPATESAD